MSTEPHSQTQSENGEPRHGDVTFEPLDVQVGTIYWYLAGLGLSVVLSLLACVYIFRFTAGLAQESGSASHNYYFASLFLVCGKAGPRWRSPGGRKPTRGSAMVNTRNTASQMICQAIVQRPSWSLGLSNRHRP